MAYKQRLPPAILSLIGELHHEIARFLQQSKDPCYNRVLIQRSLQIRIPRSNILKSTGGIPWPGMQWTWPSRRLESQSAKVKPWPRGAPWGAPWGAPVSAPWCHKLRTKAQTPTGRRQVPSTNELATVFVDCDTRHLQTESMDSQCG